MQSQPVVPSLSLSVAGAAAQPSRQETREEIRCPHCELYQFKTGNNLCRRCGQPLVEVTDLPEPVFQDSQNKQQSKSVDSEKAASDFACQEIRKRLTPKELVVLAYVVRGFSNREIASKVKTTEQVAKNYVKKILDKVGPSDRLGLALYVISNRPLLRAAAQAINLKPSDIFNEHCREKNCPDCAAHRREDQHDESSMPSQAAVLAKRAAQQKVAESVATVKPKVEGKVDHHDHPILREAALMADCTVEVLRNGCRKPDVVLSRDAAKLLFQEKSGLKPLEIAEIFHCSVTAVCQSIGRIKRDMKTSPEIRRFVRDISKFARR